VNAPFTKTNGVTLPGPIEAWLGAQNESLDRQQREIEDGLERATRITDRMDEIFAAYPPEIVTPCLSTEPPCAALHGSAR
jgi:hypothetical protein